MSVIRTATGRRIFYDDLGVGPAVLMIPGAVGSRRAIHTPLIEALISLHRVIAMDNRDSGESEPEADYYSVSDLAGDAVALLDALGITRTHIVGHSFSGLVALQLALYKRDRVDGMVLISTFARGIRATGRENQHRLQPVGGMMTQSNWRAMLSRAPLVQIIKDD